MANVRGIAAETAGDRRAADRQAPTDRDVAAAVGDALKAEDESRAHMIELLGDAEFWVAVAFVVFSAAGLSRRAPHDRESLDERADRIKAELDEARKLKDEAAKLLADISASAGGRERGAGDHRRRQGGSRAAGRRSQGQDRGIRRPPHQDGRDQDRPGRGAGARRRAQPPPPTPPSPPPKKSSPGEAKGKLADELIAQGIEDVRKKLN